MPTDDCERLASGLLIQPVNALSSLVFVLIGIALARAISVRKFQHTHRVWAFGTALFLVGLGSVAFHGPGGPAADWVHDASISVLLVLVIVVELGDRHGWTASREIGTWLIVGAALGGWEALWQTLANELNAVLAGLAIIAVVGFRWKSASRWGLAGMAFLATGALVMVLSRTGGPWCDPDSLLQGHAVWHGLAAVGLGAYAFSVSAPSERGSESLRHS